MKEKEQVQAQEQQPVAGGSPAGNAANEEKKFVIITGKSPEDLTKQYDDLKAQQPEGTSLATSPIARDAFGVYTQRIDIIKK